jgi:F0F1-type ATP synthase epsilon subunit
MKLVVVSPRSRDEYTVQWIEAQTSTGSLVIKPAHTPMIITLVAGADFSFMLSSNEKKVMRLLRPGFLEVTRESALALINQ